MFEYNQFLTGLREQSVNLKEIDGWDKDAIKGYVKGVSKELLMPRQAVS